METFTASWILISYSGSSVVCYLHRAWWARGTLDEAILDALINKIETQTRQSVTSVNSVMRPDCTRSSYWSTNFSIFSCRIHHRVYVLSYRFQNWLKCRYLQKTDSGYAGPRKWPYGIVLQKLLLWEISGSFQAIFVLGISHAFLMLLDIGWLPVGQSGEICISLDCSMPSMNFKLGGGLPDFPRYDLERGLDPFLRLP